ncbi:6-aminohexanoate hydrolase [Solibacillus sp. R5-41]|uniref:6-aminohexanoate hydrolase n=1 Tax=Solibacillus sp. R5-41 TaxID=2048654 RepID=UPI000C126E26|nr:6-aminohexanoate hydrolase [Solibacillus sp. R5-41]ATP39784.1 6-aminohexanoate hydrolase [Solibacillus sp. R5-41]ATP41830.1 6-aminohexanoate hydrolase [Solibacillus sp. R5-41]
MIDVLDRWMLESVVNFNIFVGVMTFIYIGSLLVLFFVGKKFGKPDERTNAIYLKIMSSMFSTQLIMTGVFISLVDNDIQNFRQFLLLFQAIVFLVGAISAFRLYKKDFN